MVETDPATPLLEKLTPEGQALMQQLRPLIRGVMPEATERVYIGWDAIHYRPGGSMRDAVTALSPPRRYVNLEFGNGVDLADPTHRLAGTGKRMRQVKIRSSADVQQPDARALLACCLCVCARPARAPATPCPP